MAETETLKVGDQAPDFELRTSPTGDTWKLSDQQGKNAVIINFMPAAFSGACTQQIPLIDQKRAEFEAQGAVAVGITCDNPWSIKAWREQTGVDFPILSDFHPHGDTAKKYGVFIDRAGVANRVVIVVDKDGKVAWIQPAPAIAEMPDYDPVMACFKD